MRVYLDCCCLQRPLDDKLYPRIAVEAEAVLVILSLYESDNLNLISSDALLFEIGRIPDQERKEASLAILKIAKEVLELSQEIEILANKLEVSGLKPLDALHLTFASASKVGYFCTCDDKFLKKVKGFDGLNTKVVSPTEPNA
ncbi:MAG: PIN domain-containing protein [Desulfobacterium sp.]|jgi:predicted nucleic acid-binding protein|nr:PIN domain-containing protein [Desulfobacterium sp.]MDY0376507.1 PIN domain-containing protein [Desulfobacterium sp.]